LTDVLPEGWSSPVEGGADKRSELRGDVVADGSLTASKWFIEDGCYRTVHAPVDGDLAAMCAAVDKEYEDRLAATAQAAALVDAVASATDEFRALATAKFLKEPHDAARFEELAHFLDFHNVPAAALEYEAQCKALGREEPAVSLGSL
jgi:hypothetical protein